MNPIHIRTEGLKETWSNFKAHLPHLHVQQAAGADAALVVSGETGGLKDIFASSGQAFMAGTAVASQFLTALAVATPIMLALGVAGLTAGCLLSTAAGLSQTWAPLLLGIPALGAGGYLGVKIGRCVAREAAELGGALFKKMGMEESTGYVVSSLALAMLVPHLGLPTLFGTVGTLNASVILGFALASRYDADKEDGG